MRIWALDDRPYDKYGIEVVQAARARGHLSNLFKTAEHLRAVSDGYVFVRPAQWEPRISFDKREIDKILRLEKFKFIQDELQIDLYEDKNAQAYAFSDWMPVTVVFFEKEDATNAVDKMPLPLISKASVGSASANIRLLRTRAELRAEIDQAFGAGIPVQAGAGNEARQKGYVLWQEFIPADRTWRVTRVGNQFHVYQRWNYDDKPFAAPSKIKPTVPAEMNDEVASLLDFSREFTDWADTKWVALDILKHGDGWRLLETSLAWARGNDPAGNAKFYGTNYSLNTQHELLIEEIEQGVFE